MSLRASHIPHYLERSALLKLRTLGELRADQIPLGVVLLSKMLSKGWIEPAGPKETYRITPAGETALEEKILCAPRIRVEKAKAK